MNFPTFLFSEIDSPGIIIFASTWHYRPTASQGRYEPECSNSQYLYVMTVDYYNKDGKLTTENPQYLFVSDKVGNNFHQITPSGYNLE